MQQERVSAWRCPQIWVGIIAALLALAGTYWAQQYLVGDSSYQGPIPVITSKQLPAAPRPKPVDCSITPCIALTFDDGPSATTTPQILDMLDRAQARATFFVVGQRVPGNEQLLRRMYTAGHEIGNHSWSHVNLTKLPPGQVREQVRRTQQAVVAAGLPPPRLFRPPYGAVNEVVRSQVPLTLALWNLDPEDWKTSDPNHMLEYLGLYAHPGAVIDLHDIYPSTAQGLAILLDRLKGKYQFVTMSELLNLTPGQRGMYFGR